MAVGCDWMRERWHILACDLTLPRMTFCEVTRQQLQLGDQGGPKTAWSCQNGVDLMGMFEKRRSLNIFLSVIMGGHEIELTQGHQYENSRHAICKL